MATIKVPWWYQRESVKERRPHGSNPRGTLRGGPERSADDPRRNPRGGLWGGPGRSARDPWTPKTKPIKTNGGNKKSEDRNQRPTVITVEENGRERKWGVLARSTAWRAGSFWEDMDRTPKVFLEKDGNRNEVQVEKRLRGGRACFWFVENLQQHQQEEERGNEPVPEQEDDPNFEEVEPEELQTEKIMWLTEKITTLASENEERERKSERWKQSLSSTKP